MIIHSFFILIMFALFDIGIRIKNTIFINISLSFLCLSGFFSTITIKWGNIFKKY